MIEIAGLNIRQKNLMDLLWSCEDLEQVKQFIQALPTAEDRRDAQALVQIAMQAVLEQDGGLDEHAEAAAAAIARANSRG